ncbi:hypothetical protein GCM10009577_87640 [Streptomyces javensis]
MDLLDVLRPQMTTGIAELIPGGGASHEGIRKEPTEGTTAGNDPPFRRGPCCHDRSAQERKGIDECAERRTRGAQRGARKEHKSSINRTPTEHRSSVNPQTTHEPYRRATTATACGAIRSMC